MKPTMMTYIHEEQATLSAMLYGYPHDLPEIKGKGTWLVLATGSSINAIKSAKYYVENLANVRVTVEEPFHFQHYEKMDTATDLVLGVSQSGESTSTINAIKHIRKSFPVVTYGLTSKLSSELAKTVDHAIDIEIGEERVGYVTKGYVATIFKFMLLGLYTARCNGLITETQEAEELAKLTVAVKSIPQIIDTTELFFEKWKDELTSSPRFTAIGYGPSVGVIKEMETKFAETIRVPSQGVELEAFMHGPYFEVNGNHRMFFLDTPGEARERLLLLKAYEQKYTDYIYTVKLGESSDERTLAINAEVDIFIAPLLMVIPFQILAHHIAEAKGNNLPQRIFTDFGISVKSKTKPGDYA
ncbi:putative glucosamine-fructose-6-phosphate aminotransferase [Buttiauxella brennerae ATCC 51605]|uniref:Putative glucosamine-fructose-6-phosphate aminotransferase n=1 Tax=Buttiauxella brennerae ATCC 51605 TaxID=1354251 RepID=A0A1B7IHJ2_9ENTR|nr:SIS domain-containing protein [Buttiauxella brennerae]OAT28877.1 putative glucosamine-fructose-6-phosphate aminotransferase [Buttiauxella brennerae ATCC 51605]